MKIERQVKRILSALIFKIERAAKRRLPPSCDDILLKKKRHLLDRNRPIIELSEYYFENGFRKVFPYYYNWTAMAKGRWIGRTIEDIYTKEFCRASADYDIGQLIKMGRIRVNNEPTYLSYLVRDNDRLSNFVHRHEAPVLDMPIEICAETEDFLAINKPPSIPVHPCGRYCLNSITTILEKEKGLRGLRLVHRLDRTTSGLLLIAKSSESAHKAERLISDRNVEKRYVCLVDGFLDRELCVTYPIKVLSYKHGICRVARSPDEEGSKEAKTVLRPFNSNRSNVVECIPSTGRMHQIRVHLQASGIPIINDRLYNNKSIWGERNGVDGDYSGLSDEEIIKRFADRHFYKDFMVCKESTDENIRSYGGSNERFDPNCFECRHTFLDPEPEHQVVYLHACSYTFPGMDSGNTIRFEVPLPDWAKVST